MSSCTVPLPDPVFGGAMAIQGVAVDALHEQSAFVLTLTLCGPPTAGGVIGSGVTVTLHPLSCDSVNVWSPALIDPWRGPPMFAAAVNCTVPAPFPLPDVMLIHASSVFAVQSHPPAVFTANDPDPPVAGSVWPGGAIENVQPPDCVTVKTCEAITTVPLRSPPGLGAIARVTVPLPEPLLAPEKLIQLSVVEAFHEHPAAAVTATEVVSPPLATFLF